MNKTFQRVLVSLLFIWVVLGLTGYADYLHAQQSQSQPGGGISGFPATVTGGVSGGVPCFTSSTTLAASAAIAANVLIKGGGVGACIAATSLSDNGTTVSTAEPIATTGSLSSGSSPPTNTAGTAGGIIFKEGTAFTGVSATDGIYANSTNHCADAINQTVDEGCLVAGPVQNCGTSAACSATAQLSTKIVYGNAALSSGSPSTVTITGISPAFTSSTSYVCTLGGQSNATTGLYSVANVSGSSFTITGPSTTTTVVNYLCVGT
jgi:hypothetical protein